MLQQIRQQIAVAAVVIVFVSSSAMAQFAGNAFFSMLPTSTVGIPTNNLVITNTLNGFTVAGDVTVLVPSAPPAAAGFLVEWIIDRPLSPGFTFTNWTTTTNLDGFSAPPVGIAGNTSGQVSTEFTEPGMQGPSQSSLPMTLIAGAATWPTLSNTSGVFSGNTPGAPIYFLRQHFWLDGVYQSGPGGNWVVDVPVDSFITQVPEPATLGVLATLGFALLMRPSRVRHTRA
jgi:hypothetical protein